MPTPSHLVASIDQGTNTVRLLIADPSRKPYKTLVLEQRIVRLGGGFSKEGKLTEDAVGRALAALSEYARLLKTYGCVDVSAVGTGVLRQAPNAAAFLSRVKSETGLAIEIISGEREAELSVRGALAALGVGPEAPERYLVIDIGGGSTEFALWRSGAVTARISIPIGVVSLLEAALPSDPPTREELAAAQARVARAVGDLGPVEPALEGGVDRIVGCSGTFTTIGALAQELAEYDPARITGYTLTAEALERVLDEALAREAAGRLARWPVLPKGREDVIVAGLVLVQGILRRLGAHEVRLSDGSLLEGVLLERLSRLCHQ